MEYNFKKLPDFLKQKLTGLPFQISTIDQNTKKQCIALSNRMNNIQIPSGSSFSSYNKGKQKYTTTKDEQTVTFIFIYPNNFLVTICILNNEFNFTENELEHLHHYFYQWYYNDIIKTKDIELETMVQGIRSITSSLDLDDVLVKIIKNALKIIPTGNAGFLLLYDEKLDMLIPKAYVGFNKNILNFKVKPGESISGKVFKVGKAHIYNSTEEVINEVYKQKISEENFNHLVASTNKDVLKAINTFKAIISVPVSIEGKTIGVMTLHQLHVSQKINSYDLRLLEGLAAQAAIAIQNARLFKELNDNFKEITNLSLSLAQKNESLQRRNDIHKTLMKISLENKGVNAIISELNKITDLPIAYFDTLEEKFYSNKTNNPLFSLFEIKKIFSNKRYPLYIDICHKQKSRYYLYPIFNGSVFLGCLIVTLLDKISNFHKITIEQGGSLLTLEFIKKQTLIETYYKKTQENFNELLESIDNETLTEKAKKIGIDISSYITVSILQISEYRDLQVLEAQIQQLVSKMKYDLQHFHTMIFGNYDKITILSSSQEAVDSELSNKFHSIQKDWLNNDGVRFSIGVSSSYKGIEYIRKSHNEAQKALSYLINRNQPGIIHYRDIGLNRLFLNHSSQEIEDFLNDTFSELLIDKNKELEKTVIHYINSNRSAGQTAEQLHIHINTLYQRLKKIEELLNIDFNNKEDLLKIQLACHLKSTFQ